MVDWYEWNWKNYWMSKKNKRARELENRSYRPPFNQGPPTTFTSTSPTHTPTTTPSPPGYLGLDTFSAGPSHIGASSSVGDGSSTAAGAGPSTGQDDGRKLISPSFTFKFEFHEDNCNVVRKVGETIVTHWEGAYHSYNNAPKRLRDKWFREFQLHYRWAPQHEFMIRKNFDHIGGESIRKKFKYYRKKNRKPNFVHDEDYKILKAYWASPEFLNKSQINKRNRASDCGGQGQANHTGGSIPRSEHGRRMAKAGVVVTQSKLFMHTHSQYDENGQRSKWVNERARRTYAKFLEKLPSTQNSETGETIPVPPDVELQTWVETVGIGKKGNVYGLGPEAARFRPNSSSHYSGPSSSADPELVSRIQTLEQTLQEKIQESQSQKEDYGQIKEQLAKAQQKMEKFERLFDKLTKKRKISKPPMYPAKNQQRSEYDDEDEDDSSDDDDESSDGGE